MDSMGHNDIKRLRYFAVVLGIVVCLAAAMPAQAQTDLFGNVDQVRLDSISAGPGQVVAIRCQLTNDEYLSGVSVPITYETDVLSLVDITFEGSRMEYLDTKLITPVNKSEIDGHFVVSAIKIFEDPVPPGDGLVFTMFFKVSDSAEIGRLVTIDTLFYSPGGSLLLVEDSSSTGISPAFKAGKLYVRGENHSPVIAAVSEQQVIEGDSLAFELSADDPDGDPVSLAVTSKPLGSTFHDDGDGSGRFVWTPDYIGPFSADGSPFVLSFWASDGVLSTERQVTVQVINKNRQPVVTAPELVSATAGEPLSFSVKAIDPDFEAVSWQVVDAPLDATFDGENPGQFEWATTVSDSGTHAVRFVAADPHGYADTAVVSLAVGPATVFSLSVDTASALSGQNVEVAVRMTNQLPVASFDLLMSYDPSALTLTELTKAGTRTESFGIFTVTTNYDGFAGHVKVHAVADQGGDPAQALAAGSGPVAIFKFRISSNLAFAGLTMPVRFWFSTSTPNLNSLTDTTGTVFTSDQIVFEDGSVAIREIGTIKIGDVNLNGLAYEISDVIYFTNFLINPLLYPFNALQYANSDVNQDGIAASVADLIRLINIIVMGGPSNRLGAGTTTDEVLIESSLNNGNLEISYASDAAVGGAFLSVTTDTRVNENDLQIANDEMTLYSLQTGPKLNILIYSMAGDVLPAGKEKLLTISNVEDYSIDKIDLSSAEGRLMAVSLVNGSPDLPDRFTLYQNYPNPFNPETRIDFELPQGCRVELSVYNLLGRRVKILADGGYSAGSHTVTWDGRDDNGSMVSSGVYFYRLTASGVSETRKMLLMK